MRRLRRWITARLWRRLMFSQLFMLVLTMLILQCLAAVLVALLVHETRHEEEAGRVARAYARPVGWLMESGREEKISEVLDMVRQEAIFLPDPDEGESFIAGVQVSMSEEPLQRTVAVTVLDQAGAVLAETGTATARTACREQWDELVSLALAGETRVSKLSRWLKPGDENLLLGMAAVPGAAGERNGVVAVEMRPPLPLETSDRLAPLSGFLVTMFLTSLLGLPVVLLAVLLAALSGVFTSRSLGRRLKQLEMTAQAMAGGALDLRVADTSPDEIGQVGQAFNRMAGQLASSLEALEGEKEQVETLLKARRELVANISHDLRTPIASLSAHLETLSAHPERLDEYLPILNDEAARTADLIADLFELARLDTRELELNLAPLDLGGVIPRVVASFKALAWERRRIVLEVDLPPALPPVRADVQRVEQILANLITNGLRFTLEGGVVTIEAQRLEEAVEVRVSDTGIGILPGDLPHVFERFYRGDRARSRPAAQDRLSSGSGLGLAIVKGLVEAMGGSVSASSAPGEGTCISFRLPLAA
jgi:signal transduction histidine kinase